MPMKRADQITGLVVLLFSLAVLFETRKMPMVYVVTTGPGFLPFWLSLAMACLGVLLLFTGLRRPLSEDQKIAWPGGRRLLLIGVTILGLLAYTYLVSIVGYVVSTFAFVSLLVWLLGSYRFYLAATIGLGTAVGLYLVFGVWLEVSLPKGLLIIP